MEIFQIGPTPTVSVHIDLARIRRNALEICRVTGVPLIAVVKADGYGLGARRVAETVGDLVEAFYVFRAEEAVEHDLYSLTGKRSIALLGESNDATHYLDRHIHPAVWNVERAKSLEKARPVLSFDSGQQRFGCSAAVMSEILKCCSIGEIFTHASTVDQAAAFERATSGIPNMHRHAAGSALLDSPVARFDAVRPGLALYRGATRVTARLIETHDTVGSAGYSGFRAARHGVIGCGYSNGLRTGPCRVNNEPSRILEVGMQSAFVELSPRDRVGDEVVLLGDGLTEMDVAREWLCTPHEVLIRLCGAGVRFYGK